MVNEDRVEGVVWIQNSWKAELRELGFRFGAFEPQRPGVSTAWFECSLSVWNIAIGRFALSIDEFKLIRQPKQLQLL